jgi:hypothetical protein
MGDTGGLDYTNPHLAARRDSLLNRPSLEQLNLYPKVDLIIASD